MIVVESFCGANISLEETPSSFKHLKFSVFVSQSLAWFVGVIRSCVLSYCCLIMSSCVAMWIFPEDAFKLVLHLVWQSILIDLYLMTTILLPKEIMIGLLPLQEDFKTIRHSDGDTQKIVSYVFCTLAGNGDLKILHGIRTRTSMRFECFFFS